MMYIKIDNCYFIDIRASTISISSISSCHTNCIEDAKTISEQGRRKIMNERRVITHLNTY